MARSSLWKRLTVQIPTEYEANSTHVEVVNAEKISLYGVEKLLCYGEEEIILLLTAGRVRIEGSGLYIARFRGKEMLLIGAIAAVHFEKGWKSA